MTSGRIFNQSGAHYRPVSEPVYSMIFPGYSQYLYWNTPWAEAQCAAIAALGFNTIQLQQSYSMAYTSSTSMSPFSGSLQAEVQAMALAAQAAGLNVSLKPMCTPNLGPTGLANGVTNANCAQWAICPGAISSSLAPTYTTGSPNISDTTWYLNGTNYGTNGWGGTGVPNPVGRRIVLTDQSNAWNFPGGRPLDAYGQTAPTWATVGAVVNASTLAVYQGGSPVNALANSSSATAPNYAYILDDTAAATWFTNWTTQLTDLVNMCIAVGVYPTSLNIGTELDLLTLYYESNWRSLIATLRAEYPGMKLYVNHSNTFAAAGQSSVTYGVPFYDALDYISPSCYPTVDVAAGGASEATMESNFDARIWGSWLSKYNGTSQPTVSLASMSQAFGGVSILYGELGTTSHVGAGYSPGSATSSTGTYTLSASTNVVNGSLNSQVQVGWWVVIQSPSSAFLPLLTQVTAINAGVSFTLSNTPLSGGSATLMFTPGTIGSTQGQPSGTDQATFFTAGVQSGFKSSGVRWAGFNWWTWFFANNNTVEVNTVDFAPKPAAQAAMAAFLS